LFDLDGTLLDTNTLIVNSFKHTFRYHYQKEISTEEIYEYFGKTLRAAMENLGPDMVDDLIKTYREYNLAHHDELTIAFAGVVEVIQILYNEGILLAVVTSKTHNTALRGLKLFNLDKYFRTIIGVEQCQYHKPHPEPVLTALNHLGLVPNDCLMIGDSPADLISAKSAGVKTAAVQWSRIPFEHLIRQNPDYILETIYDLLSICNITKK
jgi:pyrophosphatase PpaX